MARRRVDPEQLFDCKALHCRLAMRCCAMRQAVSDVQRRSDASRNRWRSKGDGLSYPSCTSASCPQGRKIRRAVDPDGLLVWSGDGPSGRFDRAKRIDAKRPQLEAMERLRRVGLLDDRPTLDSPPQGAPPGDDGEAPSDQREVEPADPSGGSPLRQGPVREPRRAPQGPLGVQGHGAQERHREGDALPAQGRRDRRLQVGRDPARLRVGEADPGRRGDRQGGRAARGVGCS